MPRTRYITVGELIALLIPHRRDVVILSTDSEGNMFSPLFSIQTGTYHPWCDGTGSLKTDSSTEEELDARNCIALWPSN